MLICYAILKIRIFIVMKIFNTEQIRDCDRYTISAEPVSSAGLMERAAEACTKWLRGHSRNNETFYIFCGNGNNGGDGLAIARMLYQKGFDTEVFLDLSNENYSEDARNNLQKVRAMSGIGIHDFQEAEDWNFNPNSTIVDAIFGTGLNRKAEDRTARLIEHLNRQTVRKIAVDIPSGLFADVMHPDDAVVFRADHTLSFQFWKKAFLHPETGIFCGKVHVLDIGLSREFIHRTVTRDYIICDYLIRNVYRRRTDFSHKGNFGKTCIVAGSYGKTGAAVLATKAALRSGSGITFTLAPASSYEILQSACPEAMFINGGEDHLTRFNSDDDYVYGIGPGLGTEKETAAGLTAFLTQYTRPVVLDADALNILAENGLKKFPRNSVLTPHPREFERLFGKAADSFLRTGLAKRKAAELQIFIVLKDHHTQIITPEGLVYYNITGNSGMAKGGSGDVLTGIITSLIAQSYAPEEAAVLGVWLHGTAGDLAAEKHGKEAMLATDVILELGNAYRSI